VTVFEIVLPLAFPILLMVIRNLAGLDPKHHPATTYTKKPIHNGTFPRNVFYAPNATLINDIMNSTKYVMEGKPLYNQYCRLIFFIIITICRVGSVLQLSPRDREIVNLIESLTEHGCAILNTLQ
jgi:hypothetical protein